MRMASQRPKVSLSPIDEREEPIASPSGTPEPKLSERVRSIETPPALAAASTQQKPAGEHPKAAPTVLVTIGRVEVRAVTSTPQTPRASERKARPLFSLEQYLRERNGRRR
jgi:hypothetical protein